MRGLHVWILLAALTLFAHAAASPAGAQEAGAPAAAPSAAGGAPGAHPLAPMQTFSPRQTLQNFLRQFDAVARYYRDVFAQQPTPAHRDALAALELRALRALDLSQLPDATRIDDGIAAAGHLYEVLSRIDLPPPAQIPGAGEVAGKTSFRWTLPNTPITIARMETGPRQGHYLFTAETVAGAEDWQRLVAELPPKRSMPLQHLTASREVHAGLFLPAAMIESWPAWSRDIVLGQAVWKWLATILLLAAAVLVFVLLFGALRALGRRLPAPAWVGRLLGLVPPLMLIGLTALVDFVGDDVVGATEGVGQAFEAAAILFTYFAIAWLAWLVPNMAAEAAIRSPLVKDKSLDAHLLRLITQVAALILIAVVVLHAAASVGIPVVGLVAGASVSGLVIGLAAQDALKNLIASIMIFIDKPYRVGERIRVQKFAGAVEAIGLRSTRLRLNNGHQASIPNDRMSTSEIENTGRRLYIPNTLVLHLRADTPPERLERALAVAEELLQERPELHPDLPPTASFTGIGDWSLEITVSYAVQPPKRSHFIAFNQAFYLDLLRRFREEGIALALPASRTVLERGARPSDAPPGAEPGPGPEPGAEPQPASEPAPDTDPAAPADTGAPSTGACTQNSGKASP